MLKSLELLGFKSFADRTKFEFSSGITAVVGPNGSGKSNVVDGIKWILGDQSPKSLRGKEMTDVIFNGAQDRNAAAMAEATLLFDNSSGFLPVEGSEVRIGRRLWRSGDSEYLLNGSPVRLKDVRRMLMGTGAGSAGYSIIEQGRVDQILRTNAISRRAIFEESAGISLYKDRRAEFVRRMERVDQILVRLTDIVDEVEAQRNSLRSQAEKAAAYREVSEELRRRWIGLAADDYRDLSRRIETGREKTEQLNSEISRVQTERSEVEQRLADVDGELSEIDRRLREKDRGVAALRETTAGHLSTIRLQSGRGTELATEFLRLKHQRGRLHARLREGESKEQQLQSALTQARQSCERQKQTVAEHDQGIAELEQDLALLLSEAKRLSTELHDQTQQQTDLHNELQSLQTQLQTATASKHDGEARRDTLTARIAEQQRCSDESQRRLQEVQQSLKAARDRQQGIAERRRTLRDEQASRRSSLAELREQRSGCQARITVLEDLESRQEGLGIGVREILRRAETSDYPPWRHIAGTVADLIQVDLEHAALLEAALGERAQRIVTRDFDSLRDYLQAHSSQISGRVAFLEYGPDQPIDAETATRTTSGEQLHLPFRDPESRNQESEVRSRAVNRQLSTVNSSPGVLGRADQFATAADEFADLPARILSDTWVVETLQAAFELQEHAGAGCRFITLQGELLDADGTLTVGTLRAETAVVSRKSELRQLKNELLRLDAAIGREESRTTETDSQLADVEDQLQAADADVQQKTTESTERKSEHAAHLRELQRLQQDAASLQKEIVGWGDRETALRREITERQAVMDRLQTALESTHDEKTSVDGRIAEREEQLQEARQRKADDELQLAKQKERIQSLTDSHARELRDHEVREQQFEEACRRLREMRTKRRDVDLAVLQTRASLAVLSLEQQRCADEAESIVAEKDGIRARRIELMHRDTDLRDEITQLKERLHREELVVRESTQRRETLVQRIQEEYQTDLAEAAKQGLSAFQDYLAERRAATATNDESDPPPEDEIAFEDIRGELEAHVERLRKKLKAMGAVNSDSLRDLDEIEARFEHLDTTLGDLVEAKRHLEDLVRRIDEKCRQMFLETFEDIRKNFQQLFRKAFGGGDGDVVLEDPDDVLECGIDIVARPPGKELKSISLLSGGEKSLTAFALLLAMFKHRPSPYCVLDEVDAALDEANVERLRALLTEFRDSTQFVLITHKKPTMAIADLLYGVTMEQSGVSKRLTVKFENIGENGEFLDTPQNPQAAA